LAHESDIEYGTFPDDKIIFDFQSEGHEQINYQRGTKSDEGGINKKQTKYIRAYS